MKANISEILKHITDTPSYPPGRIQALLQRLDLTEKGLALLLNVQPMTVRLWLSGVSAPCSVSRRMLSLLEQSPQVIELIAGGIDDE